MLDQAAAYNLIAKEFFTSSIESGMSWQRYLIKTSTNVETEFCALIGHKGFSCSKAVFCILIFSNYCCFVCSAGVRTVSCENHQQIWLPRPWDTFLYAGLSPNLTCKLTQTVALLKTCLCSHLISMLIFSSSLLKYSLSRPYFLLMMRATVMMTSQRRVLNLSVIFTCLCLSKFRLITTMQSKINNKSFFF